MEPEVPRYECLDETQGQSRLAAYLEGSLNAPEVAEFERHARYCPSCSEDLTLHQEITRGLERHGLELLPQEDQLWVEDALRPTQRSWFAGSRRRSFAAFFRPAAVVGAVAVLAIFSFVAGRQSRMRGGGSVEKPVPLGTMAHVIMVGTRSVDEYKVLDPLNSATVLFFGFAPQQADLPVIVRILDASGETVREPELLTRGENGEVSLLILPATYSPGRYVAEIRSGADDFLQKATFLFEIPAAS